MSDTWKAKSTNLVLLALQDEPKHGYEIMKYIEEKSKGYFSLSYGSLYPVLHELEKKKLLKGEWKTLGKSKKKKVYRPTKAGEKEIEKVTTDYRSFIAAFQLLLEV